MADEPLAGSDPRLADADYHDLVTSVRAAILAGGTDPATVATLREHGLDARWDGNIDRAIEVRLERHAHVPSLQGT